MLIHTHTDDCTCGSILTYKKLNQVDPTRTATIRNAFVKQIQKRFRAFRKSIVEAIVDQDCFAIHPSGGIATFQTLPGPRAYEFLTSEEKIREFMIWLQELIDKGLLTVAEIQQLGTGAREAWSNLYIEDSYKRGVMRARTELNRLNPNIPTLAATGGIIAAMANPFHMDRVGLLYIRTFNELKGVTDEMAKLISRILAQGMIDGDGPEVLARKILSAIDGTGTGTLAMKDSLGRVISAERRAMTIARTEMIRAHHLASIQEYRNWGIIGVRVKAEWLTAGDNRVCPVCDALQGQLFTLEEIEPMIPAHPNCRCMALPVIIPEDSLKKSEIL